MESKYSNRKIIISGFVILILSIFIVRLFYLQVPDNHYKRSAENNATRHMTQYPSRGLIFDRNGELLAYNKPVFDVLVVKREMEDFDTTDFCKIVGIEKKEFLKKLNKIKSRFKPQIIIQLLSYERYSLLEEKLYKFKGFYTQTRTIRAYAKPIAANVLGYVGEVNQKIIDEQPYYKSGDYFGISGIEKSYEQEFRGKKGIKILTVDVHNRIKGSYKDGKYDSIAIVGLNVTTTIDVELQAYAEALMKNKKGSLVAIEPSTGEILSLVTSPSYNPNLLVGRKRTKNYHILKNDKEKPLFNRAIRASYPPGSTFKIVNALIGLQEKVITTKTVLPCNGGYRVGSFHQYCHHGGAVNFIYSIQGSCNAYYSQVFMRILKDNKFDSTGLAYKNWRNHLLKFGIGRKLNTDLSYERKGIVYTKEHYDKYFNGRWRPLRLVSMAIGQGELGITPLQMANITAIVANKGYYHIPHIVKKIQGKDSIGARFYEKNYVDIAPEYFPPVIDGMELVVSAGTARRAYLPGISICGKTGTAENPHGKDHSIFIAFAPKENPKIAISVYVENAGYGGTWAAPIASLLIEKYINDSISRPYVEKRILDANLLNVKK
ncbi:MAG: penicillin-binding protein 2 [Bacteroidetes bacterium 4572_117]|nr:MAG: penicillin-binding protein 2 [Bacteroidetes bacterium 4572_117]